MTRAELVDAFALAFAYACERADHGIGCAMCGETHVVRCRCGRSRTADTPQERRRDLDRLRAVLVEAQADLARAEQARKEAERDADQLQPCPTCRCYIVPGNACLCCEMRATATEADV